MYYKIYKIIKEQDDIYNDIHILRFSYNPLYNSDSSKDQSKKIEKLLNNLIEQAEKDRLCFNSIYPWEDYYFFDKNNEIIIAYNHKTNQIQGWCNLIYASFNIDNENDESVYYESIGVSKKPKMVYTCCIDKLVARALPKIKYIGLLLLEFVRDITITQPQNDNKPILFYETDYRNTGFNEYNKIIIDILFLYSLTTSIDFYKKTFLIQLTSNDDKQNKILNHVFRYIRDDKLYFITEPFKKQLRNLCDMHIMDCKSITSKSDIIRYNSFKPHDDCNHSNEKIEDYISDDLINYNINRVYGSRTSRSYTKSKSKSIIKKK